MTFEQVEQFKNNLTAIEYKSGGLNFKVKIVPEDPEDFKKYKNDYRVKNLEDESAKKYSRNGKFIIVGLSRFRAAVLIDRKLDNLNPLKGGTF